MIDPQGDELDREIAALTQPPGPPQQAQPQGGPQFIRGQDGKIAGARIGDKTIAVQRGPDGQITGMQLVGGAEQQGPAPPPAFIRGQG